MNLDGPPDWSARLDDYLYGRPCGDPDQAELAEIEAAEPRLAREQRLSPKNLSANS